jgi:serine/threonine-protein kinase
MEFQLGETYSGYEFLDVLKRSKNGIEFRVRNIRAGRLEALRSLSESAKDDQERSERFLREMRVHASLLHPNIVTLFSAIELENHLIMTTELVEGPTLADKLRLGPIPWTEAVALIRQVLSALGYAHQERIVHRDINPENIVVCPGGLLKLANFALAKGATSPKLTQIGLMVGNLKYIPPEQIKGTGDLDARSDLYAVGMVLYEMLCGRPAFDCQSLYELMAAQVVQMPSPPDEVNAAVPKELSAVVLKALVKDPAGRYQTAAEFDQALVKVCEAGRSPLVQALTRPPSMPVVGRGEAIAGEATISIHSATLSLSVGRPEGPAVHSAPAPAAFSTPSVPVLRQETSLELRRRVNCPAPAFPEGNGNVSDTSLAAGPPGTVSDAASPMTRVPAFLMAATQPSLPKQQLIIGAAAGASLGALLVAIWLLAR